ncbi:MAG: hypothetical protein WBA93_34270, partial [Microcoleaceae cyanobacterium]
LIFMPPERGGIFAILQNTPALDVSDFIVENPDFDFGFPRPLPIVDNLVVAEPEPTPTPTPIAVQVDPVPEIMELIPPSPSDSDVVSDDLITVMSQFLF